MISSGTVAPGMDELDINARDRLAVGRIEMGDIEERRARPPRPHSNSLFIIVHDVHELRLAWDIHEYTSSFSEITDAYYNRRMYMAAVAIYELGQDAAVRHPCPHLRDSLTGRRSRGVVSMFWSELQPVG